MSKQSLKQSLIRKKQEEIRNSFPADLSHANISVIPNSSFHSPLTGIVAGKYQQGFMFGRPGNPYPIGKSGKHVLAPEERVQFKRDCESGRAHIEHTTDDFWKYFLDPILPILSTEDQTYFWQWISQQMKPSDSIVLQTDDAAYLTDFWISKHLDPSKTGIPSDIIFAKTIPLLNFEVIVRNAEDTMDNIRFHVIIFDNYDETVDKILADSEEQFSGGVVGVVLLDVFGSGSLYAYTPLVISKGADYISLIGIGWHYRKLPKQFEEYTEHSLPNTYATAVFEEFLPYIGSIWYGLELAMLNPMTVHIFSKHTREVYAPKAIKYVHNSKKKRKVVHIRKHYITKGSFKEAMVRKSSDEASGSHGGSGSFERHTLAWYVIGHWRKKKDGKYTFVKGHWRGPLRDLKQNMDAGREREVPLKDKQDK